MGESGVRLPLAVVRRCSRVPLTILEIGNDKVVMIRHGANEKIYQKKGTLSTSFHLKTKNTCPLTSFSELGRIQEPSRVHNYT